MSWISGMHNLGRVKTPSAKREDPRRIQCEQVAGVLYERIDGIMDGASYAGQMEQSGDAVKHEFVRRVADIIQKELQWTNL